MYLNLIFVDFEGEIPLQFLDTNLQILAIVQCCVMDCSSFLVERRAKGVKNSHQKHYGLVRMCRSFLNDSVCPVCSCNLKEKRAGCLISFQITKKIFLMILCVRFVVVEAEFACICIYH